MRVAINGFGRIGKLVFRAFLEQNLKNIEIIAINELGSLDSSFHLLRYDSSHGKLPINITKTKTGLRYKNKNISFYSVKDPKNLPWGKLKIDVVLECSGVFTSKEKAQNHINAGAKKVIISAPASNVDATIVQGVNNNILNKKHNIISNGHDKYADWTDFNKTWRDHCFSATQSFEQPNHKTKQKQKPPKQNKQQNPKQKQKQKTKTQNKNKNKNSKTKERCMSLGTRATCYFR